SRAASGGLACECARGSDARAGTDVGQELVGRQIHCVRTGVDQHSLDSVGVPVELALQKALAGLVKEGVCHGKNLLGKDAYLGKSIGVKRCRSHTVEQAMWLRRLRFSPG